MYYWPGQWPDIFRFHCGDIEFSSPLICHHSLPWHLWIVTHKHALFTFSVTVQYRGRHKLFRVHTEYFYGISLPRSVKKLHLLNVHFLCFSPLYHQAGTISAFNLSGIHCFVIWCVFSLLWSGFWYCLLQCLVVYYMYLQCVPKNVHLSIFQITLSKIK